MKTNIYITVDTETSIGGAFSNPLLKPVGKEKRIYGKIGNEYYGIPLIMDIADSHGLKITFFVEVLNHYYFGKDDNYEVCQYILKRGHDVQLHIHPNYLNFKLDEPQRRLYSDNMCDYDLDTQVELIKQGKELLKEFGVDNPVAFRAGNYGADLNTVKAL
ncbi:MAG: polysaccharide deacetylase, partial [Candidatus Muiribacteriota bacterium]